MVSDDGFLDQFRDDDEHTASRRMMNDIDDQIESTYPSELVAITVHARHLTRFDVSETMDS